MYLHTTCYITTGTICNKKKQRMLAIQFFLGQHYIKPWSYVTFTALPTWPPRPRLRDLHGPAYVTSKAPPTWPPRPRLHDLQGPAYVTSKAPKRKENNLFHFIHGNITHFSIESGLNYKIKKPRAGFSICLPPSFVWPVSVAQYWLYKVTSAFNIITSICILTSHNFLLDTVNMHTFYQYQ